jgi:hypothetical protein
MSSDNFTALLDELEGARGRRRIDELRKSILADPMVQLAAVARRGRAIPNVDFKALEADVERLAKAQTVAAAARPETRRSHLNRAYTLVRDAVAAGNLTALQTARAEAHLHRLAQAIL